MTAEVTAASPAASGSTYTSGSLKANEPRTEYVVFKQADKDTWNRVNIATARSADQAIRDVVGKLAEADQGGVFVAVPFRSWKPVQVAKQTVTTLKLEEAK